MIYFKKFFLCPVIYILCVSPYIISLTNFISNEKIIEKINIKRSVEEINSFNYDNEIIDDISSHDRQKRNIKIKPSKHKWTLPIHFCITYPLNHWVIKRILKIVEKSTCIRFNNVYSLRSFNQGIQFISSSDCYSPIGRIFEKSWQNIGIGKKCNTTTGILRLILRTLGVIYEHNRIDRMFYVRVHPENMHLTDVTNFKISQTTAINNFHLPYEYGSLMHFGMFDYSKNGGKTISLKDHLYENTVGQEEELTFNDIKTLNLFYCSNICKFKIICKNHGYQDPYNCYQCICPNSFEGARCENYKSLRGCGTILWTVRKQPTFFKFYGKQNCIYHLKANRLRKIKITILKIKMKPSYSFKCLESNSLEIKYWKDKSVMGARFCHQKFPKIIKSHNNYVIIHYNSFYDTNYVQMYFKETF
ncbi:Astacin-like metalloendopeptidase [Strongyloides ratti]|uniref:Metalloendopeptidase n=1 Tax=Strongyloides ratti TaxID=34506 RepID=A0A090MFZ6_STRRB|nr:Astacin-like metalloendopeptidase [Strongyloides ratti]CEG06164.1 Astacin-like metalloendopeptidase [Strongyloides ratti]